MLGSGIRRFVRWRKKTILDLSSDGIEFRTYPLDNRSENKFFYSNNHFDRDERRFIEQTLPKNGIFIDIGANAGIYTVHAARQLGSYGVVFSIEAGSEMYERLCFNCRHNDRNLGFECKIKTIKIGLSDKKENLELFINHSNMGSSSVIHDKGHHSEIVPCLPLMEVIKQQGIGHIDILKIDIEGAEYKVLSAFFSHSEVELHPRFMIVEDSANIDSSPLASMIIDKGYHVIASTRLNKIYAKNAIG